MAVPDRDDAAVRTTTAESFGCLDVQNQAGPGCGDRADVDTFDTKKRVYPFAPSTAGAGSSIGHIRVSFYLEAWSLPIQRGPDLSPPAPRGGIRTHSHPRRQSPQPRSSAKGQFRPWRCLRGPGCPPDDRLHRPPPGSLHPQGPVTGSEATKIESQSSTGPENRSSADRLADVSGRHVLQ